MHHLHFGQGRRSRRPSLETTPAVFSLLAFGAVLGSSPCPPARALDYVDVSPSGAQFPVWEGGDTELEFADIDADGHVDFLSIGDHGSPYVNTNQHGIMCYFGDGAGGWSIHQEGSFGYGGIAVGDVNDDGRLDVGYGMHHNYSGVDLGDQLLEVALGDGTGTSWTPWDDGLATSGETWGMFTCEFADVDNDGDLDLASHSFGCCNGLHVYRNDGGGHWSQTWAMSGGNAQHILSSGDVNGDGSADFAVSYQNGTVFLGDGAGGFAPANTGLPAAGTSGLSGVSLGDVDGDGCADLSFTKGGGVFCYLWRVDHWVAASSGLPASGGYEVTQLWDMNSDGVVDLAAMGSGTCTVWRGDGTGNWVSSGGFSPAVAVDQAAFRTGGDVDHNGFADFVLVQEQGSWPNSQNKLYVYRESSSPAQRFALFQFPRGNESFHAGSVQTIRWSAAHVGSAPATVALELSIEGPSGPWTPIASGLPDNGAHQWRLVAPPTNTACLRLVMTQDSQSVEAASRTFRILPGAATSVADDAGRTRTAPLRLSASPNPSTGTVRFVLEGGGAIAVHDVTGRRIRDLIAATGVVEWDGCDTSGRPMPAGVYFATPSRRQRRVAGPALATDDLPSGVVRVVLVR